MANNWPQVELGDVVDEITVGFVGSMAHEYVPNGIPFLRSTNILPYKLSFDDIRYISRDFHEQLNKSRLQPGDVVIVRTGKPGTATVIPDDLKESNCSDVVIVRSGKNVNPRFLAYFVNGIAAGQVNAHLVGAVQQHFNVASAKKLRLYLPSRIEQDCIADILGMLDDKIELNRRTNETLEAMAKALFKSWFVDFDPVHEKAAGRQHTGLDPATGKLFPDSFEDSPLGPIPKGWRAVRLSDQTEAIKGLSYKGSGLAEQGVPMHNLNSVCEGGGYKYEGIKYYKGEYRERHLIHPGDVIVANTEQGHDCLLLGYAAIVPRTFGESGLFSHHIYKLRILESSPLTPDYLCRLLNSPKMHELVSGFGNGTTVNMLPVAGLEQLEFVLPPKPLIDSYTDLAISIRMKQERVLAQNKTLAMTRDSLLPKLLSGELSLPTNFDISHKPQ